MVKTGEGRIAGEVGRSIEVGQQETRIPHHDGEHAGVKDQRGAVSVGKGLALSLLMFDPEETFWM